MGIKCGIVGLPNVGKSTLFNALTRANIAAQNYPFCTIEPNLGTVAVPDRRLDALAAIVKPQKIVATYMEFVDIAGLVKGAHKGEGLGNQFLSHIRETQAIIQVVRCFEDDNIVHVANQVSPLDDIDTIETELLLSDLEALARAKHKLQKAIKANQKPALIAYAYLEALEAHLNAGQPARTFTQEEPETGLITLQLLTKKPLIYLANVDEAGLNGNQHTQAVQAHAQAMGAEMLIISANLEAELSTLSLTEQLDFLNLYGLAEAGLNQVIRAGYAALDLHTYFTAGVKELRAWTIAKHYNAAQAAGVIHTDFEKGFIRAEIIHYEDFIRYQGESNAKENGCWQLEGRDYLVQDGDIIHFRFNV